MDLIVSIVILTLIIPLHEWYFKFPRKDRIDSHDLPATYMIRKPNRMDIQSKYECAAFSSAFVLRHFGKEAEGNQLYKRFPRKRLDGTVNPKGILIFFKKRGYDASYHYGNVNTLKKRISQGVPVIVFIRVFPNRRYLHFAPVVGYDENYFYIADSLKHTMNCNETYYNRKISINDFEALWKTWIPFSKNSYIVIQTNELV